MANLSEHISEEEYRCKCPRHELPPVMYDDGYLITCYDYLFETFEDLRKAAGRPLVITSGYRCPEHNKAVGGATLSVHIFGLALDILCKNKIEAEDLAMLARGLGRDIRLGWKKYTDPILHLDCAHFIWPRPSKFFTPGIEW